MKIKELEIEIPKKKRNKVLYHLGVPYFLGKNVGEFSIELGKKTQEKNKEQGYKIGKIIIKVVDRSHEQEAKNK